MPFAAQQPKVSTAMPAKVVGKVQLVDALEDLSFSRRVLRDSSVSSKDNDSVASAYESAESSSLDERSMAASPPDMSCAGLRKHADAFTRPHGLAILFAQSYPLLRYCLS
jgi:hypothetical protein